MLYEGLGGLWQNIKEKKKRHGNQETQQKGQE